MVSVSVFEDVVEVEITRFITIDDVIGYVHQYANELEETDRKCMLVVNAINCRSNICLSDLAKLEEINNLICKKYKLLKVAVLLDDPIYTAICMVYQNSLKSDRYHLKVFSTRSAAYRWLRY